MGYVTDPDLLPGKGGSPGYKPGMQWDVKNQKYIPEPTGHAYKPGKQWRDDAGEEDTPAPAASTPASAGGGASGGGSGLPSSAGPPSLAGLMGGGGDTGMSEGAAPHQLSGPTQGRMNIGSRMPPSLAALLRYRVY